MLEPVHPLRHFRRGDVLHALEVLAGTLGAAELGARTAVKRTNLEIAELVTFAGHIGIVTVFRDGGTEDGRCGFVQRGGDVHQARVAGNHTVSMLQDGRRLVKGVLTAAVGGALAELGNTIP